MRTFETGATRDGDDNKLDYEAFLSPRVLEVFAKYMHGKRYQSDGSLRSGDNWQKGMPIPSFQKGLTRHFFQAWGTWRGEKVYDDKGNEIELMEALCAILFNTFGYIHELTREVQLHDARPADNSTHGVTVSLAGGHPQASEALDTGDFRVAPTLTRIPDNEEGD